MDTALILDILVPAAEYGGVPGSAKREYDKLRWEDARPKPTWDAIKAAWPQAQAILGAPKPLTAEEQIAELTKRMDTMEAKRT